jgi:hypothetical protein
VIPYLLNYASLNLLAKSLKRQRRVGFMRTVARRLVLLHVTARITTRKIQTTPRPVVLAIQLTDNVSVLTRATVTTVLVLPTVFVLRSTMQARAHVTTTTWHTKITAAPTPSTHMNFTFLMMRTWYVLQQYHALLHLVPDRTRYA